MYRFRGEAAAAVANNKKSSTSFMLLNRPSLPATIRTPHQQQWHTHGTSVLWAQSKMVGAFRGPVRLGRRMHESGGGSNTWIIPPIATACAGATIMVGGGVWATTHPVAGSSDAHTNLSSLSIIDGTGTTTISKHDQGMNNLKNTSLIFKRQDDVNDEDKLQQQCSMRTTTSCTEKKQLSEKNTKTFTSSGSTNKNYGNRQKHQRWNNLITASSVGVSAGVIATSSSSSEASLPSSCMKTVKEDHSQLENSHPFIADDIVNLDDNSKNIDDNINDNNNESEQGMGVIENKQQQQQQQPQGEEEEEKEIDFIDKKTNDEVKGHDISILSTSQSQQLLDSDNSNEMENESDVDDNEYSDSNNDDEETSCSICLINRQGPCRNLWRKFERCIKENPINSISSSSAGSNDEVDVHEDDALHNKNEQKEYANNESTVSNSETSPTESTNDTNDGEKEGDDDDSSFAAAKCDVYFQPWFQCFSENRVIYALITNRQVQPELDHLEEIHQVADFPMILSPLLNKLDEDDHGQDEDDRVGTQQYTALSSSSSSIDTRYAKFRLRNEDTGNGIEVAYVRDEKGNLLGFDYFTTEKKEGKEEGEVMFHVMPEVEHVSLCAFYRNKDFGSKSVTAQEGSAADEGEQRPVPSTVDEKVYCKAVDLARSSN